MATEKLFYFLGKLYLFWLFIVTLAFMYNAYSIPLRAVFPYQTDENLKYWLLSDYLCDFIYIIDILIFKVRISFLNSGLKEVRIDIIIYLILPTTFVTSYTPMTLLSLKTRISFFNSELKEIPVCILIA